MMQTFPASNATAADTENWQVLNKIHTITIHGGA